MAINSPRYVSARGKRTVVKTLGADVVVNDGGKANVVLQRIEDLRSRAEDMEPVLDMFGRYLVQQHIPAQFRARGKPKRWAALSPKYAAWKAKHYPGKPILQRSGAMMSGFDWETHKQSVRVVNRVRSGQKAGSKPRWAYHQDGTIKMPARPMLQLTDKDYKQFRAFAHQHLFVEGGME
jgi:phage gpG-like protein